MAVAPFSLQTSRLILDPMTPADAPVVQREWGVAEVARMTATFKQGWSLNEARDWIAARLTPGENGIGLAIRRAEDRRLIGSVGMGGAPLNLGYALASQFWGRGYATEAVEAFLEAAYGNDPAIDVIEAGVFDDNPASARVLTKTGFARVGPGNCTSLARLEPAANSLYRLTRAAFEASR